MMIGLLGPLSINGGMFRHSIERMIPRITSRRRTGNTGSPCDHAVVEAGVTTQEELDRRAGGHFPLSQPDRGVLPDDLIARTLAAVRNRLGDWHASAPPVASLGAHAGGSTT